MLEQAGKIEQSSCPRTEIAAYLDCELSPPEEFGLEEHMSACEICRAELNMQKKLLCALDFALEEKQTEIEIPQDFARVVVVRAESHVSGLRNREERGWAVFLCALIFFVAFVALGAESEQVFSAIRVVFERFLAILSFLGHLIYDIALITFVVLRSLSNQDTVHAFFVIALFLGFLVGSWLALPRILNRLNRT
jgi:hypothetical protein